MARRKPNREIHGMTGTPTYNVWRNMRARCYNPRCDKYHRYGGRGIEVCGRWRDSFIEFYSDMGDKPAGRSLDRIDNNGNYSPENCRWSTQEEQCLNKEVNVRVTIDGATRTFIQWCRHLNITPGTVYSRLYKGWDMVPALTIPAGRPSIKRGKNADKLKS